MPFETKSQSGLGEVRNRRKDWGKVESLKFEVFCETSKVRTNCFAVVDVEKDKQVFIPML
jgi:hypothetical protein